MDVNRFVHALWIFLGEGVTFLGSSAKHIAVMLGMQSTSHVSVGCWPEMAFNCFLEAPLSE